MSHLRFALLASALSCPALAHASEAAETPEAPAASSDATDATADGQYLPADILVIGERAEGYDSRDGSTGMRTDTPLIDVPQAIHVLTEEQIDDQGIRALGDALRYVPGVSLETGEGHRDEIFIRGQETTADFYIDGLRDDAQYYRPLYNVARIEVLKGANALIFGRGGGGGVVNRVVKAPDLATQFAGIEGSLDSFGAFSLAADINQAIGAAAGLRLNATYEEFANHRDVFDGRFIGVSPSVAVELGPDTFVSASYTYDDDERVTDRGIPALGGAPISGYDETFFGDAEFNFSEFRAHIARARIDHEFSGTLRANATLQFADYDKQYSNIVPAGATAATVDLTGYRDFTERQNLIGQANLVAEFDTGGISHTLLSGVEGSLSDTANGRDQVRFGTATRVTVPLGETIAVPAFTLAEQRRRSSDLRTVSAYVQDQISLGEHIELIAGARYEIFDLETIDTVTGFAASRTDRQWSPRFGVIVKPQDTVSLYASYTESFLPAAGDQFVALSQQDAALEPERFENIEFGAKWAIRPDLFATAALFRLTRTNTPATDPTDPARTVLTGESRVEGFEISLAGQVAEGLQANLGYTWLDGEITSDSDFADTGTRLQQLPEHQIAAWARYDFTPALGIGGGVIHQSDQFASFSGEVTLPAYTRVDAAVFWDISEAVSLQLNVENLLDVDYYPSAHGDNNIAPGAPLNASVTLRARF